MTDQFNQTHHVPVLLSETLEYLNPQPGETYLDLTAGYGGHAGAIRLRTHGGPATLVDRDVNAIAYLQQRFSDHGAEIVHADFLSASRRLHEAGRKFDLILADLGVSSPHLNIASRGFAFQKDGPLDMRMDQTQVLTADTIVNTFSEDELIQILKDYGEEPHARRIAKAIVANRPLHSTAQLAQVVAKTSFGYSKVHPATRTFQALRIAVNDELGQVSQAVPLWVSLLRPGGRLAVISFHSLEDRLVKEAFTERAGNTYDAEIRLLTKRPVTGDKNELVSNPRARSAKLRAAAKIKI